MSNEKSLLLGLGCPENTIKYIGDGVYAGFDGHQIWRVCAREADFHYIALEQSTCVSLHNYVADLYSAKKEP